MAIRSGQNSSAVWPSVVKWSVVPLLAAMPIQLEYFSWWYALGALAIGAIPIVWLGMRSLNGLGPVRKWVAIGVRLAVLAVIILILGGVRFQRQNKNLEVMVLRDISDSTQLVTNFPGKTVQKSVDSWLIKASDDQHKPSEDRVGVLSFADSSLIDAMPSTRLVLDSHAIRNPGAGTDVAAAIQLGLATLSKDAMHRLVIVWDGNATTGDVDAAVAAAAAQHVQIDVMPLRYDVQNEVLVDRFVAPTWKRENEPFTIDVVLRSTNRGPVQGKMTVTHQGVPMDLDPSAEGIQPTRTITLQPGLNVEHVRVPSLSRGVHQFHATFDAPNVTVQGTNGAEKIGPTIDTLSRNNSADAFTFVQGRGQILYVDNTTDGQGNLLKNALRSEGIDISDDNQITPDRFPNSLLQMENYDAVILANVPRGSGGLTEDQQKMLANYVHDLGGGLVMIGGDQAFGAGGWQGSKLEEILPVNMDIPARREIPKGALVLVMHSCEMPEGNYWGEQCAIKAIETLSGQDEIGIISYAWQGPGGGGAHWDFELAQKGDSSKVMAAVKKMQLGDMPSFDDSMDLALNGRNGTKGLKDSDARQKHVIVISDGDPGPPNAALALEFEKARVSVSTVTVYPHGGDADGLPPTMKAMTKLGGKDLPGRAYGPINANPNQLPQIFIKEARVVRRTLIQEDLKNGFSIKENVGSTSDIVKGFNGRALPVIRGLVLTSRKDNPLVEVPWMAGKENDPVLAHWQTGLGKALVYTSDATDRWGSDWISKGEYSKFWAQVVRGVSRPPMSSDFDVQTTQAGDKGHINVEALNKESGFKNFLNITGTVVGPDGKTTPVRLVQSGPGTYAADFDTLQPGNYVLGLQYVGPKGEQGRLVSGVAMNNSPELRDLHSNDSVLAQIAQRTGGRVLPEWNGDKADLFNREGLAQTASPLPIWDIMIPVLLGLILIDVATRRIAWDWLATKRMAANAADYVRSFTTVRKVETAGSLDALRRVREQPTEAPAPSKPAAPPASAQAKFEAAKGVEGDISKVVGGAVNTPTSGSPKKSESKPTAESGGGMGSLMEAKRRAQQKIRDKEQGNEGKQ